MAPTGRSFSTTSAKRSGSEVVSQKTARRTPPPQGRSSFPTASCGRSASCRIEMLGGAVTTNLRLSYVAACATALTLWATVWISAGAQTAEYAIKVLPPGGPAPRLADGHPDLSGHWFPNGAGQ